MTTSIGNKINIVEIDNQSNISDIYKSFLERKI